jgi:methyl-accepting chemotaxis protein
MATVCKYRVSVSTARWCRANRSGLPPGTSLNLSRHRCQPMTRRADRVTSLQHMKIADFKIGTRLGASYGFLLLLMTLLAAVGLWLLRDLGASTELMLKDAVAKERMVTEWASDTELNGMRTAVLVDRTSEAETRALQEQIDKTSNRVTAIQKELDRLMVSGAGRSLYAKAHEKRADYTRLRADAFSAKANGDAEAALRIANGPMETALQAYLSAIRALADHQKEKSAALEIRILAQDTTGQQALVALWAIATVAAVACTVVVTRSITRPLRHAIGVAQAVAQGRLHNRDEACTRDETGQLLAALNQMNRDLYRIVGAVRASSGEIATASVQIASGNLDLSSRTEQQAGALEETASSMEELTTAVKQNADNARQADQMAIAASGVAVRGGQVVAQVVQTMESINGSASKITDIISVIDGIAFQTNILALNAAVEAARAGEQGRGFAVVASEVRNLAHRSASAAKEIKALIEASVRDVAAGTELVATAGNTMDEIVASVGRVTAIMRDIALASREQESGLEQINQAIGQMDTMTQQNAALVEEASAASAAMSGQAQQMEELVGVFKLEGNAASPARERRAGRAVLARPEGRASTGPVLN